MPASLPGKDGLYAGYPIATTIVLDATMLLALNGKVPPDIVPRFQVIPSELY
jgi:hypothetical protein